MNIKDYFVKSSNVIKNLAVFEKKIIQIAKIIKKKNSLKKNIFILGNGGSSSDAEHFAGELVCTYDKKNRKPFSIFPLTTHNAAITAWGNDFSYDSFFKRVIQAYVKKGDLIIFLSTSGGRKNGSGKSTNLVKAAYAAKNNDAIIVSLTGKTGGVLKKISDINININSAKTSFIQEAHMTILHSICEILE